MQKTPDWKPDTRAEQFVIESRQTWVTGVSKGPPTKVESYGFEPPLHGVSTALISSGCNDVGKESIDPSEGDKLLTRLRIPKVECQCMRTVFQSSKR